MVVCVSTVNALSGKPDGGAAAVFGKPNDFDGAIGLVKSRVTPHALAGLLLRAKAIRFP